MKKLIIANNETRSQAEFDKEFEADYEPYGIHLNKVLKSLCSYCMCTRKYAHSQRLVFENCFNLRFNLN